MRTILAVLVALPVMTGVAHGETAAAQPAATGEPPFEKPISAADVHGAPLAGDEHGRVDPLDPGDGVARKVGRVFLWIPRIPFEIVAQPVKGFFYLQDRYDVIHEIEDRFRSEDKRISIFPTALFETGFGLNIGFRARFKDLFHKNERLAIRVGFGGEFNKVAALDFTLPINRLTFGVGLKYERADADNFYGYGNGDEVTPVAPIDPLTSDQAFAAELRVRAMRATTSLKYHVTPRITAKLSGAVVDKDFDSGSVLEDEIALEEAFDTNRLPGFERGTRFVYTELEVAWDSRRQASKWDAPAVPGTGGLALGYIGRQEGILDGERGFFRMGFDLQRLFRLTVGPRVLQLRAYGELVTGARDTVPFSELPRIGGSSLMRGYEADRFRDRAAVVTQASYLFAASSWLAPSLFVDVGRVYSGLDDLTLDDLRVGYGGAIEIYTPAGLLMRVQIATSPGGDLIGFFSLNPVTNTPSRVERR